MSIDTKKPTFWRQLQGAIDLGYSFSSGNSQTAMNVNTDAAYRTAGMGGRDRLRLHVWRAGRSVQDKSSRLAVGPSPSF